MMNPTSPDADATRRPRWITCTALVTAFLVAFDGAATYVAVAVLHIATEANPLLAAFADSIGVGPAMTTRTLLVLILLWGLWLAARQPAKPVLADIGQAGLRILCVAYGALAIVHISGTVWAFQP